MPKQKRRSLPGVLLLAALIASAVALGVYGNKLLTTETGSGGLETGTGTPTLPGAPETTTPSIAVNETAVTPPTNTTS